MDSPMPSKAFQHPIFITLNPIVQRCLGCLDFDHPTTQAAVTELFLQFEAEFKYICVTHALSGHQELSEAEVVVGTITARCSQRRWRKERIHKMGLLARNLEAGVRKIVYGAEWATLDEGEIKRALEFSWTAWQMMADNIAVEAKAFSLNSFALIMLGITFECLERLGFIGKSRS